MVEILEVPVSEKDEQCQNSGSRDRYRGDVPEAPSSDDFDPDSSSVNEWRSEDEEFVQDTSLSVSKNSDVRNAPLCGVDVGGGRPALEGALQEVMMGVNADGKRGKKDSNGFNEVQIFGNALWEENMENNGDFNSITKSNGEETASRVELRISAGGIFNLDQPFPTNGPPAQNPIFNFSAGTLDSPLQNTPLGPISPNNGNQIDNTLGLLGSPPKHLKEQWLGRGLLDSLGTNFMLKANSDVAFSGCRPLNFSLGPGPTAKGILNSRIDPKGTGQMNTLGASGSSTGLLEKSGPLVQGVTEANGRVVADTTMAGYLSSVSPANMSHYNTPTKAVPFVQRSSSRCRRKTSRAIESLEMMKPNGSLQKKAL